MSYLPVDIEKLLYHYLTDQEELASLGVKVTSEFDPDITGPWVRQTRIGGGPPTRPLWIDQPRVQFDCYGGTKGQAWTLCATVAAALQLLPGAYPQGVVTDVAYGVALDLPDRDFDPARPRYILGAVITTHPLTI